MNILIRLLIGLAAMACSLGSAISTMTGGADMTLADIGNIPLVAWLFSFGAFAMGVINGKMPEKLKVGALSLVTGVTLMLGACAGGPVTDLDREFFADQFVTRSLDNAKQTPSAKAIERCEAGLDSAKCPPLSEAQQRAEIFLKIAKTAESAATPGVTSAVINLAINEALLQYTSEMSVADRKATEYLARRMLPETPDIHLPLTDEQRRIIGVYVLAIKDAVETWQASR